MADLLLILRIGGERVAFPASDVESVIEIDEVTPVPGTAPHIAGLSALRSRVLTVIDGRVSLGLEHSTVRGGSEAVVVPSDGHLYAVLVDGVEDVVEASAPRVRAGLPLSGGWQRVLLGTVEAGGDLLLLVDPHALVAGPAMEAAA
ncbi:chemotaxis protein CheW [Allosphingosinicella sp.]|jgi:purine-binding chemotaxis protein CheW|uniref:chemotaxis protein CheW n=1 Tax=Allosphingosinicella sp. TaxID=2823234 RepID=UPI002F1430BE